MLLLPNGSVMTSSGGSEWDLLIPDSSGSYVNGTWTRLADSDFDHSAFASQVLPDGRVLVAGGADLNLFSETYNPLTNAWTVVPSPIPGEDGFVAQFGEAESTTLPEDDLPNGDVMLSPQWSTNYDPVLKKDVNAHTTVIFDPATNIWSEGPELTDYNNDQNASEATWVKLQDDSILLTSSNFPPVDSSTSSISELFVPSSKKWVHIPGTAQDPTTGQDTTGSVPVPLFDPDEEGAATVLSDGRAFFVGATGLTALYKPAHDSSTGSPIPGTWAQGPSLMGVDANNNPVLLAVDDAPLAMLPDGTVLLAAGPKYGGAPTTILLYNPAGDPGNNGKIESLGPAPGQSESTYMPSATRMLDLPNGQVLFSNSTSQAYVYSPGAPPTLAPTPVPSPAITSIVNNPDGSLTLSGTYLNGLDAGAAYGDDAQMDTNCPIISLASGANVYYATSYGWSTSYGLSGGGPSEQMANFRLPLGIRAGTYSVVASANGISSAPVPLTISTTANNAAPTIATLPSASPSEVTGTTTTLSVLGQDDTGESNLVYTWTATTVPAGARLPSFSVNGSSAETANGTNLDAARSTNATFYQAGTYTFTVVVTDAGGLSTTSQVTVTVDQTLTSGLTASPSHWETNPNATHVTFHASALDQFGFGMAVANPTWSVSDDAVDPGQAVGTISSSGEFTPPAVGTLNDVYATAGGLTSTAAQVGVVASPWVSKDVGSPALAGFAYGDASGADYTVEGSESSNGSGTGIQSGAYQLVYQNVAGENEITARVVSQSSSGEAGVIFRSAFNTDPNFLSLVESSAADGSNSVVFEDQSGVPITSVQIPAGQEWLRMVYVGSASPYAFYGYRSDDGVNWFPVGSVTLSVSVPHVGLVVASDNKTVLNTSKFDNVSALSTSPSAIALSAGTSPDPSNISQALAFQASVTVNGSGAPDGDAVTLVDTSNDQIVATGTLSGGSANLTVPVGTLAAGIQNLVAVYDGDGTYSPSQSVPYAQTVLSDSLPHYITASAGAAYSYNATTGALGLTSGTLTFTADSATDTTDPPVNLTASGSNSSVVFNTSQHLAGLTLNAGAQATMLSLGAARTHDNHDVLVIGTLNSANDPTFSIDSQSKLDLTDNDLIVHTGTSDAGGSTQFRQVVIMADEGRNAPVGSVLDGTWTGNGLTSSAAAAVDGKVGYEQNVLAVVLNSDQVLGKDAAWTVGNFSEPLGPNDVIVKYTYNGDAALEGYVGDDNITIVNGATTACQ